MTGSGRPTLHSETTVEQTVNIADLVKPKFNAGQDVFAFSRDYRGRIEWVRPYRIQTIQFLVDIKYDAQSRGNPVTRSQSLRYYMNGGAEFHESNLVTSLDDLPADDRKPTVG